MNKRELKRRLAEVILTAEESGIDVRGGYAIANSDGEVKWDVEITEVELG